MKQQTLHWPYVRIADLETMLPMNLAACGFVIQAKMTASNVANHLNGTERL